MYIHYACNIKNFYKTFFFSPIFIFKYTENKIKHLSNCTIFIIFINFINFIILIIIFMEILFLKTLIYLPSSLLTLLS